MMVELDNHIDELHQQLEEERLARAELERELHQLHLFIRSAGHDMKTPITTLKTSLYLLQRKPELAVPERLTMMEQQLERMTNMVDAMGLMARLDGETALVYDESDILAVVQEAIRSVADIAEEKSVDIQVETANILPDIQLNFEESKRALVNILDNAVRHSESQSAVNIEIFESHGYLCVDVMDSGAGLTDAEIENLFEPFFRGDDTGNHSETGVGMGLPIARRIIELHGGKIRVMTEEGSGSTFRLMFPVN